MMVVRFESAFVVCFGLCVASDVRFVRGDFLHAPLGTEVGVG